jgi:tetratricopeptide (TPR) repeat protein
MFFPTEGIEEVYGGESAILAVSQHERTAIFMRHVALATMFLLICPIAIAQHHHATTAPGRVSPCKKNFAPAVLNAALQKVNWPVPGITPDAQKFFSQGMTQYYGFNYEEALRNFRAAAAANGKDMAMASWGIALAAGPNINLGMDHDCHGIAIAESKKAALLASTGGATDVQKALIDALPLRYAYPLDKPTPEQGTKALEAYSCALKAKWNAPSPENQPYQNDTNFGALYAESLIELHPWALYDNHLDPTSPDTETIINVLRVAEAADRRGVGWNHFWIHVFEAGPTPEKAEPSAKLLQTLVEASGHLVHMPSHIYLLLGDYKKSLDSNIQAAAVDVGQYGDYCSGTYVNYSGNNKCPELYYGHYLSHNYFFGSVSATFSGKSETAVTLACETRAHAERFVANEPGLQRYMTAPLMTLVVNRNWKAILDTKKEPKPPEDCYMSPFVPPDYPLNGCHIARAIWYWAQGMATVGDSGDVRAANTLAGNMGDEMKLIAGTDPETWGNNPAVAVLNIGKSLLIGRNWWAAGSQGTAIQELINAVGAEDELTYDEPPQWFTPVRVSLGGVYLRVKDYEMAEKIFDEALERHPESGRALYGKMRALEGKGAPAAVVDKVRTEFCHAWRFADYTMTDADLWPASSGHNGSEDAVTCKATEQKVSKPSDRSCDAHKWPPVRH